jgi:hypothetical protein
MPPVFVFMVVAVPSIFNGALTVVDLHQDTRWCPAHRPIILALKCFFHLMPLNPSAATQS